MSQSFNIIPGNASHSKAASQLIYESSHALFDFMFSDQVVAETVIGKLYQKKYGHFSYQFSSLAVNNDHVVGMVLGYDLRQLSKQDLLGSVSLFLNSPVSCWAHLMTSVRHCVDNYVPKPSKGAYYINNIAVAKSHQRSGLGQALLSDTLRRAKDQGYASVELDVSINNENAIKFYEKNNFVAVSQSGNAESIQRYGLPSLVRMIHQFDNVQGVASLKNTKANPLLVTDVTGLYPVKVDAVFVPSEIDQLQRFVQSTTAPISIGGGRFSMGGQVAEEGSLHVDLRGLNKIVHFDSEQQIIRVQGGIRWRDIQTYIDGYGLAIKIMQTYSDFTVGGSISVNCHGRYIGLGPLSLSIRSLQVMLHNGELVETSANIQSDLFYSVVGGYGAVGIITEAEFDLVENTRVERVREKLSIQDYLKYFKANVRDDKDAVFHNADLYPPFYQKASVVTWSNTDKPVTTKERLNPGRRLYLAENYFMWAITETPFGKWRREYIIDPLIYLKKKVHWRNYEAGYNVNELEPLLRDERTYVLQEYFVPINEFLPFTEKMTEILCRHGVNVVNISVRHAHADPGPTLSWAREEVFAFVLYYKQRTRFNAKQRVAVWTRELIDAAIDHQGSYYLPYQPHGTSTQFNRAYPNAKQLFIAKKKFDPKYRFRNCLWDRYFDDGTLSNAAIDDKKAIASSEFLSVYKNTEMRDEFYRFLQNVYRLYPEDRFHALIMQICEKYEDDVQIYQALQEKLPSIKPALSDLFYALPSLKKQKHIIAEQTAKLLSNKSINGYLEIGSTGRYVRSLRKSLDLSGPVYLSNETTPDYTPAEIAERGQLTFVGEFFHLNDYAPISENVIKDQSVDLVTCYIGLHHCPPALLDAYVKSIHRILRKGGVFILRDHDARTEEMKTFVSLVHTVFNAGLGVDWEDNQNEKRFFNSVNHWVDCLVERGFLDTGARALQDHDPSLNTLMGFTKL